MTDYGPNNDHRAETLDDEQADRAVEQLRRQLLHDAPLPSGLVARLQAHNTRALGARAQSTAGARVVLGVLLFSAVAITQRGAPLIAGILVAALFAWRVDFGPTGDARMGERIG